MPEYGVTFGSVHSYRDWGVSWNGQSNTPPESMRALVEVPYRNGVLDVTGALTNKIFYKTRTLTLEFIADGNTISWPKLRSKILSDIHGRALHVTLDSDPDFYWDAYHCEVSDFNAEEGLLSFSVECEVFPYKLKQNLTSQTFIISDVNVSKVFSNSRMEVNPTIFNAQEVQVKFTDSSGTISTIVMSPGTHVFDNIEFVKGDNTLIFSKVSANASVTVSYREGEL